MSEKTESDVSAAATHVNTPEQLTAQAEAAQRADSAPSGQNSEQQPAARVNLEKEAGRESQEAARTDSDTGQADAAFSAHAAESPADLKDDSEARESALPAGEISHGRFNGCFNGLSRVGPLALLLALACMAWPIFWQPMTALYCPAELKSVTAFLHSIATSSWLAPTGLDNGSWTAAQWPVFSWLAALLAFSPGLVDAGYLLPATTFICAFFAVIAVWCLAHAAGFGYKSAFAAGLILLCSPVFAPLPSFVGPATLAAGLLLFSLVFFCRGWSADAAWFSLPVAFVLTALAFLCGGWFFLAVPLIASFCFLIWRAKLRRAHRLDAIFGFILMILIIGIWLAWIMLGHVNDAYLSSLFNASFHFGWPPDVKWLAPVAIGIIGTLPWLLTIFGVSWVRVFSHAGQTLSASRHDNGSALVWISLVISLPIAILTGPFHPEAITIACLAATLLGKAMLNLGNIGNRFFCLLAALCLIIAGAVLLCASFSATQQFLFNMLPALPVADLGQKIQSLSILPIIGALVLLGGIIALMFVKRFSAAGPLIYGILLVIILCQPARLKLVSELAAMPGTPLVTYAHIEGMVMDAMAQPAPVPDAAPASPEPAAPATSPGVPTPQPEPLQTSPEAQPIPESPAPQGNPMPDVPPVYTMPAVPDESPAQPESGAAQPGQPGAPEQPAEPGPGITSPGAPGQAPDQAPAEASETAPEPTPPAAPGAAATQD